MTRCGAYGLLLARERWHGCSIHSSTQNNNKGRVNAPDSEEVPKLRTWSRTVTTLSTNAIKVTVSVLYWYEELFQKHLEQFLGSILFFSFFSAYKHRYKFTFFHVSPVVRCHPSSDKSSRKKRAYGTQDSRVITDLSTNWACSCLTSQIGRDVVFSTKCGRTQRSRDRNLTDCIERALGLNVAVMNGQWSMAREPTFN